MAKVILTFKLGEEVCVESRDMARQEGRSISEIMREAVADWLEKRHHTSIPDFIAFMKEQKSSGRSWAEVSSLVLERCGISLTREQVKSLLRG
ncbi:MAG: ribbon-helix-helix domain-containing protein [Chloroflexi bacterium]|nr:ribbon-helix-helix domain-containing protein [Chloroflexota bacterium]